MKIVARRQNHSQVKMSLLKCCVAKSANQINQLSGTQFSRDLSGIFAICPNDQKRQEELAVSGI